MEPTDHYQHFSVPYNVLVNDPNSSVVEGDIITLASERHSRRVYHTVAEIVAPFGKPLEERPSLLTQAERDQLHDEKRARKEARRLGKEVLKPLRTTAEEIVARRPQAQSKTPTGPITRFMGPKISDAEWEGLSDEERQAIKRETYQQKLERRATRESVERSVEEGLQRPGLSTTEMKAGSLSATRR